MSDDLLKQAQSYYDRFSVGYEDKRGGREPGGYHDLLDDLEVDIVRRYGTGKHVLEVGCGTGLLLHRFARFAERARGIDLSEGMLEKARARGLDVVQGSATSLPFDDEAFDVACSFKVLAHIPDIELALSEMLRVLRPGGHLLAEFYNPYSLRALAKRAAGYQRVADGLTEEGVYTRFDAPDDVLRLTPKGSEFVTARGIRVLTPAAFAMRVPVVRTALRWAEERVADGPLARFGGFYVAVWRKAG